MSGEDLALLDEALLIISVLLLEVADGLAVDLDVAAVADLDDVLVIAESIAQLERFNSHWLVVGTGALLVTVSESDKGVDGEVFVLLVPGGDGEEGADDVAVDGEVLEVFSPLDGGEVEEAGPGEIVPVLLLESMLDVGIDIVLIPVLLGRQVVLAVSSCGQDQQGQKNRSCSHIPILCQSR